ncbi:MAG: Manganese transport system ATP-binding protein MntB [Chlamydiia bacterium]|nr:Manganese transport system ATP-binding protein MntB [Chlamydiia bacterium]MCH9618683.1 Manganese transport system ATP-binding protein MntB [Chlamydiia bacterium]MCH9624414.1 Manganese transport system ATP-binding protein MntB [Chlamydiia bacterium]
MDNTDKDYITVHSLTVHYDTHAALIDINLKIKKGQMTAVIGPNGAGKSSFIKAMLNLVNKTSGFVSFFGKSFDEMKQEIAYVSQTKEIDWNFPITVKEVVLMGCYARSGFFKSYSKKDLLKCHDLLVKFGLLEKKNCLISELSGGQRQRLFIARAYMQDAEIYIFDEPMAFVDFTTSEMIIKSMKDLKAKGKTIICIHHDLDEVKKEFDEVILLAHYLVDSGPTKKVLCKKNLVRAYRSNDSILTEAFILSKEKESGQV